MKYFAGFVVSVMWRFLFATADSQPSPPDVTFVSTGQRWREAYTSCRTHFLKSLFVPKTSNLSELQDILPKDESYVWLGARVEYTDWKWTDGCDLVLEEGCAFKDSLSPSRTTASYQDPLHCLQRCKTTYAALQETECLCLETLPQLYADQDVCSYRCIDNFDRRCGGRYSASLYALSASFSSASSLASSSAPWDAESGLVDQPCAYLSDSSQGKVVIGADDCGSPTVKRPAICQKCSDNNKDIAGSDTTSNCSVSINSSPVTWLDAQSSCRISGQELVTLTSNRNLSFLFQQGDVREYWIGLRRQAELRWLNGSKVSETVYSGPQSCPVGLCLAAKTNSRGEVTVEALNCSTSLPFLCDESDRAPPSQRLPCSTTTMTTSAAPRAERTYAATSPDVSSSTLSPSALSTFSPTTSADDSSEKTTTTISERSLVMTASAPSKNGSWQMSVTQAGSDVTSHSANMSVPVIKNVSTTAFTMREATEKLKFLRPFLIPNNTSSLSDASPHQEHWRLSETTASNRLLTTFPKETTPAEISGTSPSRESSGTSPSRESSGTSPSRESSGTSPSRESSGTSPSRESSGTSPSRESSGTSPSRESSGTSPSRESVSEVPATAGPSNVNIFESQSNTTLISLAGSPSSYASQGSQGTFRSTLDSKAKVSEVLNSLTRERAPSTEAATSVGENSMTSREPRQSRVTPGHSPAAAVTAHSPTPVVSVTADKQPLTAGPVSIKTPQSDGGWTPRDAVATPSQSGSEKTGRKSSFATSDPWLHTRVATAFSVSLAEKDGSDLTPVYVVLGVVGALAVLSVVVVLIVLWARGRFQFPTWRSAADRTSSQNSATIDNRLYGSPGEEFVVVERHEDRTGGSSDREG